MKPPRNPLPDDAELAALLARRYRDTTPEFEARWVELKREFRAVPVSRRPVWFAWLGALTAAATLVFVLSQTRRPGPDVAIPPSMAELFTMDAVLSRGTALLSDENRDALLHLPLPSQPQN